MAVKEDADIEEQYLDSRVLEFDDTGFLVATTKLVNQE